jgi:hypothetical protein
VLAEEEQVRPPLLGLFCRRFSAGVHGVLQVVDIPRPAPPNGLHERRGYLTHCSGFRLRHGTRLELLSGRLQLLFPRNELALLLFELTAPGDILPGTFRELTLARLDFSLPRRGVLGLLRQVADPRFSRSRAASSPAYLAPVSAFLRR